MAEEVTQETPQETPVEQTSPPQGTVQEWYDDVEAILDKDMSVEEALAYINKDEQAETTEEVAESTQDVSENEEKEYNNDTVNSLIEESPTENNDKEAQQSAESVEEPQPEKISIKANGQYYEFTQDELVKLAPKALNYTKKMQQIAPFRRSISAMQENGITEDDINQLIEMKKGNKVAIANFLDRNNVSTYDVSDVDDDDARSYRSNKYGQEVTPLSELDEELRGEPNYNTLLGYVQNLDSASKLQIQEHPETLRILMNDINAGFFDKIAPEANKRSLMNKRPILDSYIEVATEQMAQEQAKIEAAKKAKAAQSRNTVRQKAKVTGNTGTKNIPQQTVNNDSPILSDEELEYWEKQFGIQYL